MELWARAFNRINSLCKKKLLRGYCPLKSAHKGLQQTREEITADLQLVSFCEGSVQARRFTLSFSRCHLMKFYKLGGSRQGQCVNGRGTRRRREWVRWFGRRCSCPRPPCRATLCRGSHAPEQGFDHFSSCRSHGIGFREHSGGSPSGQAKLLVGWRQKATKQV